MLNTDMMKVLHICPKLYDKHPIMYKELSLYTLHHVVKAKLQDPRHCGFQPWAQGFL